MSTANELSLAIINLSQKETIVLILKINNVLVTDVSKPVNKDINQE